MKKLLTLDHVVVDFQEPCTWYQKLYFELFQRTKEECIQQYLVPTLADIQEIMNSMSEIQGYYLANLVINNDGLVRISLVLGNISSHAKKEETPATVGRKFLVTVRQHYLVTRNHMVYPFIEEFNERRIFWGLPVSIKGEKTLARMQQAEEFRKRANAARKLLEQNATETSSEENSSQA